MAPAEEGSTADERPPRRVGPLGAAFLPPAGFLTSLSHILSALSLEYRAARGSIFMDGLVGGMFLAFLMATDEKCFNEGFHDVFFVIGILHFLSRIVGNLADYGRRAAAIDGEETRLERKTALVCVVLQHLIKLLQFPALVALGYYVFKFNVMTDEWTMVRDEVEPTYGTKLNCTRCYCDRNHVNLATLVFSFQLIYGLGWLTAFVVMWLVDRDDDAAEMEEQRLYLEWERKSKNTLFGRVKQVVRILGKHSFFNEKVASTTLSISLALPFESCKFHVTEWFLIIGIIFTLTGVMQRLLEEVEHMARKDGIINDKERYVIEAIRIVFVPLFIVEVVAFFEVVALTFTNLGSIDLKNEASDHFCVEGVWHLMKAMCGIYTVLLLFRVFVIVASQVGVKGARETAEA